MSTDANEPAYPDRNNPGLTKREYFAAMAMKGLLSDPKDMPREKEEDEDMDEAEYGYGDNYRRDGESCTECCCRLAVEHADELIRQLNK